jgi:hypothetical protein
MVDIALCIEELIGIGAKYFGSTTANTKECFDDLVWNDNRTKPKWEDILICWDQIKDRFIESELSLQEEIKILKDKIQQLESKSKSK